MMVVTMAAALGLSACGVVYKSEVLVSGCIASARTFDEVLKAARVDVQRWGPGSAEIEFISQSTAEPQRITVACDINRSGELDSMEVAGIDVSGEQLERANEAFLSIARSAAWNSDR
jgi:hypothetical protein